jgi:hypothetical protein
MHSATTYENAPATSMLATHCAACGRPLLDAESVELGIGPICRERFGFDAAERPADWGRVAELALDGAWPADSRNWANALVHRIAIEQRGPGVPKYIACIDALGFRKLARRIAERVATIIVVDVEGESLLVKTPFSVEFNEAVRAVRGQRFDNARKVRVVPASSRTELWKAIKTAFGPGTMVAGSRLVLI